MEKENKRALVEIIIILGILAVSVIFLVFAKIIKG